MDVDTVYRVFMGPRELNSNSRAPFGLGRNLNFTWDGGALVTSRLMAGMRMRPIPSLGCAKNPSACFYDDYFDGVWNFSHFGVALVGTEPHFANADPAFLNSLARVPPRCCEAVTAAHGGCIVPASGACDCNVLPPSWRRRVEGAWCATAQTPLLSPLLEVCYCLQRRARRRDPLSIPSTGETGCAPSAAPPQLG